MLLETVKEVVNSYNFSIRIHGYWQVDNYSSFLRVKFSQIEFHL